jgi:hypothetical protein
MDDGKVALFFTAAAALAALTVSFLFGSYYLPSVDFPQHAVQLSAWVHYTDPAYDFSRQFAINYRTPYLLSYLLARPFVSVLGVVGALKLVVLLATVANVVAYASLLRAVGQDVWLSLLSVPLTFGFTFSMGFINFLLATPLVIGAVTLSLRYAQQARWQRGAALAAVLGVTFLSHGFAFVVAALVAFIVYFGGRDRCGRRRLQDYWPFVAPALIAVPWLLGFVSTGVPSRNPTEWALTYKRALAFPGTLVSMGGFDPLAIGFGCGILATFACSLGKPLWSWHRCSLYIVALAAYLFVPITLLGVAYVFPRFAALVIPGAILNTGPSAPFLSAPRRRALIVVLSIAWMAILISRTRAFNTEAVDFDRAVANLSCARLRPLIISKTSEVIPELPVYLHFPAYYQAAKGGYLGFSFARYNTVLMCYRPGIDPGMEEEAEWEDQRFDAPRELPFYDCVVARADRDREPPAFRVSAARRRVNLTTHVGNWWVYRTHD